MEKQQKESKGLFYAVYGLCGITLLYLAYHIVRWIRK